MEAVFKTLLHTVREIEAKAPVDRLVATLY